MAGLWFINGIMWAVKIIPAISGRLWKIIALFFLLLLPVLYLLLASYVASKIKDDGGKKFLAGLFGFIALILIYLRGRVRKY